MLLLSCICALISTLAVAAAGLWQRYGAPKDAMTDGLAFEKSLYTSFLADLDRRVALGDIDADMAAEERAQAARALLKAGEAPAVTAVVLKPGTPFLLLAGTVALSFVAYMVFGHPTMPDQPYKQRLAVWTHMAQDNPDSVPPQALAAVMRQGAVRYANDPVFWQILGQRDMLAGNSYDGAKDYERARALSPQTFTKWGELGEALTFVAKGTSGPDAQKAFAKALELNPNDARAHYYLGKMNLAQGHFDAARVDFQIAYDQMPPDDSRRPVIMRQLAATAQAEAAGNAMKSRISGMVATLQAQLAAQPEDVAGWARLLRSYDVLGDQAARDKAVAAMQAHYHDRPGVAAAILDKAKAAVGAEAVP